MLALCQNSGLGSYSGSGSNLRCLQSTRMLWQSNHFQPIIILQGKSTTIRFSLYRVQPCIVTQALRTKSTICIALLSNPPTGQGSKSVIFLVPRILSILQANRTLTKRQPFASISAKALYVVNESLLLATIHRTRKDLLSKSLDRKKQSFSTATANTVSGRKSRFPRAFSFPNH